MAANQTVRDVLLVSVLAGALLAPGSIALAQSPAGDKASARPAHSAKDEHSSKGMQFAGKDRQELSRRMGESLNKVMTGCFINGAAGQAKSEASKLYKQSLEEAASGKIDQAKLTMGRCIKLLQTPEEKALVKKPEMAAYRLSRAYLGRGNFSIKTKDFNGAVQDLTCAINASPNYALPYVLRGVAYGALKDKASSARDMRKAMGLKALPDFLLTELARDKSYQSVQSDIRREVDIMDKKYFVDGIKGRNACRIENFYWKGRRESDSHRYKEGIASFTSAIAAYNEPAQRALYKNPKMAEFKLSACYQNRAYCSLMLKDYAKAVLDLGEAIKLRPGYKVNYINRGKALSLLGRNQEAQADFDKAKNLKPEPRPQF